MTDHTTSIPTLDAADAVPTQWTGRLEFDLTNGRGWRVGTIEVVVRHDILTLWLENRTLAVMDRDQFREWLIHPNEQYEIDDVVWYMQGVLTCLTIDSRNSYAVPGSIIDYLVAMI